MRTKSFLIGLALSGAAFSGDAREAFYSFAMAIWIMAEIVWPMKWRVQ